MLGVIIILAIIITVTIALLSFVVMVVIICNWGHVVSRARRIQSWFWQKAKRKFPGSTKNGNKQKEANYVDEEETLIEERRDMSQKAVWKRWKESYKHFLKMEDSEEKLRRGYGLMIGWLKLKGADVNQSDTPLEVSEKVKYQYTQAASDEITDEYNKIRYGDQKADFGRIHKLAETLRQLEKDARIKRGEKTRKRKLAEGGKRS